MARSSWVGSPVHNPVLRETLGWPEAQYEEVKAELAARRIAAQFEIATAMPLGFQVHRQGATGHVQGRLAEAVALVAAEIRGAGEMGALGG